MYKIVISTQSTIAGTPLKSPFFFKPCILHESLQNCEMMSV